MKDLNETERIVFNEIKNSAYESVEATWERIRNFPNIDIRQIVVDNFEGKQDVADKIVNVITDPDAVYEKNDKQLQTKKCPSVSRNNISIRGMQLF
ncbi:hypothetical protein V2U94_17755 [Paenibacillus polymyxa]|nr:hypothetical protein [Paenibacillus polymyxa]